MTFDYMMNSLLQCILNVSSDILNQVNGILLFRMNILFVKAFKPTFLLFALKAMNVVCLEVIIWLKFKATHSIV